tara:strand:+ start:4044 stop:4721 length:678 start_codon:yes stop_codon:yes gene_type:complete
MIITDAVLDLKRYWSPPGSAVIPPTGWDDVSRFATHMVDGAGAAEPDWEQSPGGLWYKDFDGNDYGQITCPQCDFTAGDFSIIVRIGFNTLAATNTFLERGAVNTSGYMLQVNTTGRFYCYTSQGAANQSSITAIGSVVEGTVVTLALSRVGADIAMYIDGVDATDTAGVHVDPVATTNTMKVGIRENLVSEPLNGPISAVKIFSYALNADQQMQKHINLSNNWE